MTPLDILYTPLDTPPVPKTDIPKLLSWIEKHAVKQELSVRYDASEIKEVSNIYPWNIIYPRYEGKWNFDFDKEFPELAEFFYSGYGIKEEDVYGVVLLPVKNEFAGVGFWHSDPDIHGIRLYIENHETEGFLLMKPTVTPYDERPDFYETNQDFSTTPLQDKVLTPKLQAYNQTFYLNNTRAIHAVNTINPGTLRIAVIIVCLGDENLDKHLDDLVVRSAEKFKDYAILWEQQ